MMQHYLFFMSNYGAHAYGHYIHDIIMDDIELGERITEYEDDVVCSCGIQAWLHEKLDPDYWVKLLTDTGGEG